MKEFIRYLCNNQLATATKVNSPPQFSSFSPRFRPYSDITTSCSKFYLQFVAGIPSECWVILQRTAAYLDMFMNFTLFLMLNPQMISLMPLHEETSSAGNR